MMSVRVGQPSMRSCPIISQISRQMNHSRFYKRVSAATKRSGRHCSLANSFPSERKPEERVDSDQRPSVTRNVYLQLHPLKRLRR